MELFAGFQGFEKGLTLVDSLGDEATQGSYPACQALNLIDGAWRLHVKNRVNFIGVGLNPPLLHNEPKKFTRGNPKYTFFRVEPHLVSSQNCKGISE